MSEEHIVVKGLITPAGWDKNDNVVSIALAGFDEEEYLIDRDKTGMRLISFLRSKVQLSGIVRYENGAKRIKVEEYFLLKEADSSCIDPAEKPKRTVRRGNVNRALTDN